jgi:hypothetical protein
MAEETVFLVFHNFRSHDMFVPMNAKIGNPKLVGVFRTRTEAEKQIRDGMDDYILERQIAENLAYEQDLERYGKVAGWR